MWKIALLFFIGIVLFQALPTLPTPYEWGGLGLIFIVAVNLQKFRPMAWAVFGFAWAGFYASLTMHATLPIELESQTVTVEGRIDGLPEHLNPQAYNQRLRFNLQVSRFTAQGVSLKHFPKKIRLSWYLTPAKPLPDEQWRLQVRLKRPHGWRNPVGGDYELWAFQQSINATGYVRKSAENRRLSAAPPSSIDTLRWQLAKTIQRALPNSPTVGIINALLIGERSGLSHEDWNTFVNTGTVHLMAISGLHIGIVFGWCYLIGRWLWVIHGRLPLLLPAQKIGLLCGVLGALFYASLAGFSIPTQRAIIMLLVGAVFFLASRKVSVWNIGFAALFLVLLYAPLSILNAGFWLSFWAVALIFSCLQRNKPQPSLTSAAITPPLWQRLVNTATAWGKIQAALLIGLAPMSFYLFQKVSLIAPLANLIAVPWVGFIVIPLIFLGVLLLPLSLPLATLLWQWAANNLAWLNAFLRTLEHSPVTLWQMPSPSLWAVCAALLGVGLVLLQKRRAIKVLGILLYLPLFSNAFFDTPDSRPAKGHFKVVVFDIGQGLATAVQTQNHTLIYDTGPYYSPRFSAVNTALIPYLNAEGIGRIDRLIIGHADKDHSGGTPSLNAALRIDNVMGSRIAPFQRTFPHMTHCQRGQTWKWDGVTFKMLSPLNPKNTDPDKNHSNNASCVLKISTADFSVLMTGDIEKPTEQWLLKNAGTQLPSDVLIAPHHGSLTSSTPAFIKRVKPEAVVFSSGYRNRYGFPKPEVVQRYQKQGSTLYTTAQDGAIIIESNGQKIQRYRAEHTHYWHH